MEEKKKVGRPKKDITLKERVTVRFTENELIKLEDYCEKNKVDKSDLIRNATLEKIDKGGLQTVDN